GHFSDLAHVLGKPAYNIRRAWGGFSARRVIADRISAGGSGGGTTATIRIIGSAGHEVKRCSRVEVHDAAELPLVNDLLYPSGSIAKEEMARSKGQFIGAVAGDLMLAIETQQRPLDRTSGRIPVVRARIRVT